MPIKLRLYYLFSSLICFSVALLGYDSLYPKEQQILWMVTSKTLGFGPAESLFLIFGGVLLTIMVGIGMLVDKAKYGDKKQDK